MISLLNSSVFVDPSTGDVWQKGDTFVWDSMGLTLQRIADSGVDEVTVGQTAFLLVEDIQAAGGNMTMEDLASY